MLFLLSVGAIPCLLASCVTAIPTGQPSCSSTSANANFDDLTASVGAVGGQVPTPYKGLFYQSFTVIAPINTGLNLPAILPHSPPNIARTSSLSQTTAGTPMLTTNYPATNVTSFTLESFYFACVASLGQQPAAAAPTACLVAVTGYRGNDNQVSAATQTCAQQFQYNPSTMLGTQQMAFSGPVLGCFKDIQFLIIQYSLPGGLSAAQPDANLVVDDVRYTYQSCA